MVKVIENNELICKIEEEGAEIRSLFCKANGKEYIWQINESVWGSSSPVLFPAIGKMKSGKIEYQGKKYNMPKHGIIRHNKNLKFLNSGSGECSFVLESSAKTLEQYPFQFSFQINYRLEQNKLIMTYTVENIDKVDMFFACGGHTAYACPINAENKLTDYVIEFPKSFDLNALTLGESGFLSNRIRDIYTDGNLLELSESLFNEDALIFKGIAYDWVRLRKKEERKGVVVKFKGYPNLALWSKPGADYVCIEPWLGLPDREDESIEVTEKLTYKSLKPNERFSTAIETLIE